MMERFQYQDTLDIMLSTEDGRKAWYKAMDEGLRLHQQKLREQIALKQSIKEFKQRKKK